MTRRIALTLGIALSSLAASPQSLVMAGGYHKGQRVATQSYAYALAPAPATTYAVAAPVATYSVAQPLRPRLFAPLAPAAVTSQVLTAAPAAVYLAPAPAQTQAFVQAAPTAQLQTLAAAPASAPALVSYGTVAHYTLVPSTSAYTLQSQPLEVDAQSLQQGEAYAAQYTGFAQKLGGGRVLGGLVSAIKGQIRNGIRHRGQLLKFGADIALRFIPGNFLTVDDIVAIGGIVDDLLGGGNGGGGNGGTSGGDSGGGTSGGGNINPIPTPGPTAGTTTIEVSGTLTLHARPNSAATAPPQRGSGSTANTGDAPIEWQGQFRSLEAKIQSLQNELQSLKSAPPTPSPER